MVEDLLEFDLEDLVSPAPSGCLRAGAACAAVGSAGMVATFPHELSAAARLERLDRFLADCEGIMRARGVTPEAAEHAELIQTFDARTGDAILLFRFPLGQPEGSPIAQVA